MITPIKGLVIPWFFLQMDHDKYHRLILMRVRRIVGRLWWVVIHKRHQSGYKQKAMVWLGQYVDFKYMDLRDGSVVTLDAHCEKMLVCASKQDGSYLGPPEEPFGMIKKHGITEFYRNKPGHNTASVGWSQAQQKWYGWSHRAIHSFGVGYIVTKDADLVHNGDQTILGMRAGNLDECRMLAGRFAEAVS